MGFALSPFGSRNCAILVFITITFAIHTGTQPIRLNQFLVSPRKIVTDKLASYRSPRKTHYPLTPHITDKWANNRAENSHQVTRIREGKIRKFKSLVQAQRFLSAMGEIYDHFQIGRHKTTAKVYRILFNRSFELWRTIAQNPLAA